MTAANGFVPNATYSAQYLNVNGAASYKDLSVFYGAKANTQSVAQWDLAETDPEKHSVLPKKLMPAILEGDRMLAMSSISDGMFKLNGFALGAATPVTVGAGMQASDLKTWINTAITAAKQAGATETRLAKFSVSAANDIKVPAKQINLKLGVTLAGATGTAVSIASSDTTNGYPSLEALVTAINNASNTTKVVAKQDANGDLVLGNLEGTEGNDITVSGVVPNSLGIATGAYKGRISITRELDIGADTPVELGFGTGTPADLVKLGFKTGAYIKGSASEDLLVFVTGSGDTKINATYSGAVVNAKESLRTQPLQIKFDTATHYTITDIATQTEVASRNFDPTQSELFITYQGLKVGFSSPPKVGDLYTVDGNKDGTGNNENMLAIANLESKGVMGGSKTMGAYYIDHVNDMGNIARQAAISQSALQVVYDQAVTARDEVSGVSLDQEAADLIRFQQAYQAAAKILQVASQLFDSVLQVR
jgi:flagellar hook-associated protein FlgK